MNPDSIFQSVCEQFQKGQCLRRSLEQVMTSFDKISDGDPKPEFTSPEQLLDEAANYFLYKWCLDHHDNRFTPARVVVPVIEPDLSAITFDQLVELLSPATVETRNK